MRGERLLRANHIADQVFPFYYGRRPTDKDSRMRGIYRKTKVPCSCDMCGNPRRRFGKLTVQERREPNVGDED